MAVAATALIWALLIRDGPSSEGAPAAVRAAVVSPETSALLADLSTEQKARELILGAAAPGRAAPAASGGVLILSESWPGAAAAPEHTASIREQSEAAGDLPPLIATRQEGGEYRELTDLPPNEREIEVGDLGERDRARAWGEQAGAALAAAGFDLNLGPVADIATLSSPIADRAFSDDPAVAAAMTSAAARGCRQAGIACAPSHFPGLGGASQDTGAGPAIVSVDRATLLARDLAPFAAAFDQGSRAVLVSNALYAAFDGVTPASQSPQILDGLLRGELGFEGVAITDDLEAGAIRAGSRVPDAAVSSIAAGADMVQISDPDSIQPTLEALVAAAEAGEIGPARLDAAAGRVLELKRRLGLLDAATEQELARRRARGG